MDIVLTEGQENVLTDVLTNSLTRPLTHSLTDSLTEMFIPVLFRMTSALFRIKWQ